MKNDLGIITHKKLLNEVILPCVENDWSKKSAIKLKEDYLGDNFHCKINLAMCMLENAPLRDGGKILCQSTYMLEGDDPLILTAHDI